MMLHHLGCAISSWHIFVFIAPLADVFVLKLRLWTVPGTCTALQCRDSCHRSHELVLPAQLM